MSGVPIANIAVQDRSRNTLRNIDSLARSIRERGLLHPVVVREVEGHLVLVAGQRRIEAARSLGWTEVPVTVVTTLDDEMDALCAEGEENTEREPFTPAEAVEHRRRIRDVEAKAAKERQREGQERGRSVQQGESVPAKLAGTKPHEQTTRARTAKATGYGHATLDKAEEIVAAAEDETEPGPVREAAKAAVSNLSNPGAKVDREFKAFQAERAKHNPELANAEFRKNLAKALSPLTLLPQFEPERVANAAGDDLLFLIDSSCKALADWHAAITKLRGSGLRVVQGGQQ